MIWIYDTFVCFVLYLYRFCLDSVLSIFRYTEYTYYILKTLWLIRIAFTALTKQQQENWQIFSLTNWSFFLSSSVSTVITENLYINYYYHTYNDISSKLNKHECKIY